MLSAVIDIGSNSIRLVFFECSHGHAQPVFNEKMLCSLGALIDDGRLNEQAKQHARAAIARFASLLDARRPDDTHILATAAIRHALDGEAFAKELESLLHRPVQILSGMDEAVYAAKGVQAATYQAEGLVIDLGGGSLELARIARDGNITPECSIPIGSLAMAQTYHAHSQAELEHWLGEHIAPCNCDPAQTVYAVGGSFRAIARHQMKRSKYPLRIIHDYRMSRQELLTLLDAMKSDEQAGKRFSGVSGKRQEAVLPAAIILNRIMHQVNAQTVVFSSSGIREGALQIAAPAPPDHDPLLAMVRAIPKTSHDSSYVDVLMQWICAVVPVDVHEVRLLQAFCEMSEIAMTVHADYRSDYAFERLLSTAGYGMNHSEQVMLALALYHRHRAKLKLNHAALDLLSERQQRLAYVLGQLADIAYCLSAGSAELLAHYRLEPDAETGAMTLKLAGSDETTDLLMRENWRDGLGEQIRALSSRSR